MVCCEDCFPYGARLHWLHLQPAAYGNQASGLTGCLSSCQGCRTSQLGAQVPWEMQCWEVAVLICWTAQALGIPSGIWSSRLQHLRLQGCSAVILGGWSSCYQQVQAADACCPCSAASCLQPSQSGWRGAAAPRCTRAQVPSCPLLWRLIDRLHC